MQQRLEKSDYWIALAGLVGILIFYVCYPRIFPLGAVRLKSDAVEIRQKAQKSLQQMGYRVSTNDLQCELGVNQDLLRHVEKEFSSKAADSLILDVLPIYTWSTVWSAPKGKEEHDTLPVGVQSISLTFDTHGREIGLDLSRRDDSLTVNLDQQRARQLADSLLAVRFADRVGFFQFFRLRQTAHDYRVDTIVEYKAEENVAGLPVLLEIAVLGDRIGRIAINYDVPSSTPSRFQLIMETVPVLLVILGSVILYLFFFVRYLRADGMSFRYVAPVAVLVAVITLLSGFLKVEVGGIVFWEKFISVGFSAIFIGFIALAALACSDAVVRHYWDDKLLTLDAMRRGQVRHRSFALAVLRGFAYGALILGLTALLLRVTMAADMLDLSRWNYGLQKINSQSRFFQSVIHALNVSIWQQVIFIAFLTTLIARYFGRTIWVVVLVGIFWGLGLNTDFPSQPVLVRFVIGLISGGIYALVFWRFDLLTALFANLSYFLFFDIIQYYYLAHPSFRFSALSVLLLTGGVGFLALVGYQRLITSRQLLRFTPAYVTKLLERQRLQRELEIARKVQLSFLPRILPRMANLQMAGKCIPALDVGGDYYDFIPMGASRIGVAIGDVSGKGISAAFYMTLTKGFLRSCTRTMTSPRSVLSEINKLFYENVERGHFISMIYAVFDLDAKTLTFARAGHNPIIAQRNRSGGTEMFCPSGIALGLEGGPLFDRQIEEMTLPLESGDVYLLYTDGFSEALNAVQEEFGEDRLRDILVAVGDRSAQTILNEIENRVQEFVGNTLQHDDMTLLVVKIL
ncbi:PP2C family protein-serine/threonine phosphatase [candidate division KSB1 bacterium]|nr:PP2C family protein-serine/threonine phosphatase [candidate division KSB1 bacterium]